jgi:hypothetical protein
VTEVIARLLYECYVVQLYFGSYSGSKGRNDGEK